MAEKRSDLKKKGGVSNILAAVYEKFVLLMAIFSACFFVAFIIDAFTGDMRHGPGTQAACNRYVPLLQEASSEITVDHDRLSTIAQPA